MSQGYSYAPPTLDEAIKAYQRAKEKAKQVENYSRIKSRSYLLNQIKNNRDSRPEVSVFDTEEHHNVKPRRRLYSQGSVTEMQDSDNTSDDYDRNTTRRRKNARSFQKLRNTRRREQKSPKSGQEVVLPPGNFPAWSQPYPNIMQYPQQQQYPQPMFYQPYTNMQMHPSMGMYQNYPYYMNSGMPPYCYPQPPAGMNPAGGIMPQNVPPGGIMPQNVPPQYNMQPAVPMNRRDFQRDCKYSPAPSRPYSDSDLLETLSTRSVRDSRRFSVVPPIKQKGMNRSMAAEVIQRNYRGYRDRQKSAGLGKGIRDRFVEDYADKLIDELLVEELLPDLLVEVLLYGVKDIKLPNVEEGVVNEHAEQILEECIYDMLRSSANAVMSEIIAVYSNQRCDEQETDRLVYMIDELIALEIRATVTEFMKDCILDFQCERIYNQLIYETISMTVYEEVRGELPKPDETPKKVAFNLDNIILASVLCRSLVPNEDYVLDSVIAQSLANQLKLESDKAGL